MISRVWRALLAAAPVKIWAQIGAGIALTLVFVGFGLVIWLGPWAPERQAQQLQWLGWGMISAAFLILVAVGAVTLIYLVAQLAYLFWKWRRNDELGGQVP